MKTTYTIYRVGEKPETCEVDWPEEPGYHRIDKLVRPLLDGANLEHVTVLHNGERADLFVDDVGLIKGLFRNPEASEIYQAAAIARRPDADRSTLPSIYGTAILFARIVWT